MAAEKANSEQVDSTAEHTTEHQEPVNYEAILTGVVALASLFGNCVEAFGLVHPSGKWEKQEQLLLAGLGIQQARLLIWGDTLGVCSPPLSVTDRAIPKHPSAAYPDLKEPTFFGARDARLDEPETRQKIESALSALVDRSAGTSREEMMEKYGLKPPKKFSHEYQPALDTNRLEAFRERHELLKEVAETYAHINTRRQSSITSSSWVMSDYHKFASFIKLTQEKIDFLINLMDVKERVDRGMRMDIRGLGWHLSADRARIALDVSKLRLIKESCQGEYPEYITACDQALDNIERERRENVMDYNPYAGAQYTPVNKPANFGPSPFAPRSGRGSIAAGAGMLPWEAEAANGTNGGGGGLAPSTPKERKPSIFSSLFKRKSTTSIAKDRAASIASSRPDEPPRSMSDSGPVRDSHMTPPQSPTGPPEGDSELAPNEQQVRSKSVGDVLHVDEETRQQLEQLKTADEPGPTVDISPPSQPLPIYSTISAHDQYQGLGRQGTKTQW